MNNFSSLINISWYKLLISCVENVKSLYYHKTEQDAWCQENSFSSIWSSRTVGYIFDHVETKLNSIDERHNTNFINISLQNLRPSGRLLNRTDVLELFKISSSLWLVTEHFKHVYWERYQENSVHSKRVLIFYEYYIWICNLNPSLNLNSVSRSQHQYSLHFFSRIRLPCRKAMHNFFELLSSVLRTSKRYGPNAHARLSLVR